MAHTTQTIQQKVQLYKDGVHNEIAQTVNEVLNRIYPDEDLNYFNLTKKSTGLGTNYYHPISGNLIAKHQSVSAHTRTEVHKSHWGGRWNRDIRVPRKDNIIIFSPTGNVDTRINIQDAPLSVGHDRVPVITGITEYYPPKKISFKQDRNKKTHDEEKERDQAFKRARNIKILSRIVDFDELTDHTHDKALYLRQQRKRLEISNGFHDAAFKSDESLGATGRTRRHRIFKLVGINDSYHAQHQRDEFTLEGRISKDQYNHANGDYTVIQHKGGGYNTTLYSASGARLEQSTYNSEGELMQSLGSSSSGTLRKKKVPMPSDAAFFRKAKAKNETAEKLMLRQLQGCSLGDDHYNSFELE